MMIVLARMRIRSSIVGRGSHAPIDSKELDCNGL